MAWVHDQSFNAIAQGKQTGVDVDGLHAVDAHYFWLLDLLTAGQVDHVECAAQHLIRLGGVLLRHIDDDDSVRAGGMLVHLGLGLLLPAFADCQHRQEVG